MVRPLARFAAAATLTLAAAAPIHGQSKPALPPLPAPLGIPAPGPATDAPYAPQPILQGGIVVPLYPPGSPLLKADRVREAEQYNMSQSVPGRISSIVNIHNPSIEFHTVDRGLNTGAAVILAAGGGHNTLNVGSESADFVPFFYNYGVNTVILRNRLRSDGYDPQADAVNDALQAIRVVRAHAKEWNIDPNKIGIMGFSAGAELSSATAVLFDDFDKKNTMPPIRWPACRRGRTSWASSIPARRRSRGIARAGDPQGRAAGLHRQRRLGRSRPRDLGDGLLRRDAGARRAEHRDAHVRQRPAPGRCAARRQPQTGGLTDRSGIPFGTWQYRFIDWFRDLGFLQKPGVETKAAKDVATFVATPPPAPR